MLALPDFIQLSDEQIEAEKVRQDRLRREFNSRVRQSGAQTEFARALIIEGEIRSELDADTQRRAVELNQLHDRLAEVLAAQGRFIEAEQTAADTDQKEFYRKAAAAVHDATECDCTQRLTAGPNGRQLKMPKYREIKQAYSIPAGSFGYLLACNACDEWIFKTNTPNPQGLTIEEWQQNPQVNDLQRLKA